jgi:nucleoside-diphosphate-sugar epimerase
MALSYIQEQINQGKREINLGKLDPNRDFTNTSDMANAIYMLIQTFNSGIDVFNLGQGQEYSVMEIVEAFEHCLCEKKTVVQDPERIRKPDTYFGKTSHQIRRSHLHAFGKYIPLHR